MPLRGRIGGCRAHEFGEGRGNALQRGQHGMRSPSKVRSTPNAASHSRIALSSIASNTGARSPGEELMTCNTSAVAVCCSSASRVSVDQPRILHRDHRLRGEVLQQRDLLVGKRPDLLAVDHDKPEHRVVPAQRHAARCARRRDRPARRAIGIAALIKLVGDKVEIMDDRSPATNPRR